MTKKILITYGTPDYNDTLRRIRKEARSLRFFDKVIVYRPRNIPEVVKSSPLFSVKKGGGLWVWKPYIIQHTIKKYPDAFIVYSDAGCTLLPSDDWQRLFDISQVSQCIMYRYADDGSCLAWEHLFGCGSPQVKHWTKKSTMVFLNKYLGDSSWTEDNKICGGFIACCGHGSTVPVIDEWLNLTLKHPELVCDPTDNEAGDQEDGFVQHRHDQCLLTALAHKYMSDNTMLHIMPEPKDDSHPPFVASRIKRCPGKCKKFLYPIVHKLLGDRLYNKLKH